MFLVDCHNHTTNSYDGETPLFDMCDAANRKGFAVYCITEHYDCEAEKERLTPAHIINCYKEIDAYKAAHPTGTKILKGIELGQILQGKEQAKWVMDTCGDQMDFVIGSLHNVKDNPDFYLIDYAAYGSEKIEELCEAYYQELYEMSKVGGFDTVGHITYPYRYAVIRNVPINLKRYDDIIEAMMKNLIHNGIAMEINTSGFRQGVGETLPGRYHLKMYKELGGELLTVGSDAHRISDHGKNISDGLLLAKEMGFEYITYFEKRKPIAVKID